MNVRIDFTEVRVGPNIDGRNIVVVSGWTGSDDGCAYGISLQTDGSKAELAAARAEIAAKLQPFHGSPFAVQRVGT